MIKFSKEKVLLLHQLIIKETGGIDGIRDISLLESALESAYTTFDGKELYPTKEEKAARIAFSLINNHAFIDGNKRIGIYVLITFLEVNGISIEVTNLELEQAGIKLASGQMSDKDLLDWIHTHKV